MIIKQVIVVRNDLRSKLRHGKLAAQVAHASMGAIFSKSTIVEQIVNNIPCRVKQIVLSSELEYWFNTLFTKIVLRCDNEEHLLLLHDQVKEAGLPYALIKDAGNTVFNEPTYTCLGIGPATDDQLSNITDGLKMY